MVEIGCSPEGDISLTDGFYNFTLFKRRFALREPRMEPGLHHIGVEVDCLEEVKARYFEFNPRGIIVPEPADIHHGELRIYGPECNPVSLSEKGFGVSAERRLPRIGHVAYNALDPEGILGFFTQVLGLREVGSSFSRRQQGRLNRFVGDGFTNVAIHPFYNAQAGHEARFGINHIGFLVKDLEAIMEDLRGVVSVKPRPADRPYAEFRFRDPEGNAMDLSQTKGWEVDVDKWDRAA
jgi:catechol 2,3-dioxygenase-like lactoylglutathione lyase family enzyme